jgi:hypothetical protein
LKKTTIIVLAILLVLAGAVLYISYRILLLIRWSIRRMKNRRMFLKTMAIQTMKTSASLLLTIQA